MASVGDEARQRWRILVQGIVQGVGFRPFVYTQASGLGLSGFVLNDSRGVTIEIEGPENALHTFRQALSTNAPPLARIDTLTVEHISLRHENTFTIRESLAHHERCALISPDSAMCDTCLDELYDHTDRRYHYPFLNCTNCGPRFTIIQDLPYDRDNTTMSVFPLCPECQAEYDNPLSRRFHAQPNACPSCGPRAQLLRWREDAAHKLADPSTSTGDPIVQAAQWLTEGSILAIKGLGGYHLACNALDESAVQRLRLRKAREARPFALMVPDLATARALCEVSEAEAMLLTSRQRPIVLLTRRAHSPLAPAVAPAYNTLGLMLPYTPLHSLLLAALAIISTPGTPTVLVMTSGNSSHEPIIYRDEEAYHTLKPLVDGMLTHNRTIHTRCDDSILRISAGDIQVLRRARGYVPEPIALVREAPIPLLACGGHLKNTFCLTKGRQAFLSQHIGNLESLKTLSAFQESIEHFQRLCEIVPQAVAYDLHPEYLASKYALDLELPQKIGIQHHHAHIASVMAEHGLTEPVIGVAIDGTGYGSDGAIWGCEIMRADYVQFQRLAHLAYVPLPGGEQAVRQPWRMAAVYLRQSCDLPLAELDIPFVHQINPVKWRILEQMIVRELHCPPTSSLGRLFDAVAALLGLPGGTAQQLYEGQAAIELEQLACGASNKGESYPFHISEHEPAQLDVRPLIRAIVADICHNVPASQIARRFHTSIAALLAQACACAHERTGLRTVVLSGGVVQNRLLLEDLLTRLESMAFQVYLNRRVPPNDGGLSLGQLAIAAARLQAQQTTRVSREEAALAQVSPGKQEV